VTERWNRSEALATSSFWITGNLEVILNCRLQGLARFQDRATSKRALFEC
jgi:hypothetical protein